MTIKSPQIDWTQSDNLITAHFNIGSHTYVVTFTKSVDNFNTNIKQIFLNQANIIIPDDSWKITIELYDTTNRTVDWFVSDENGLFEFSTVVAVTQQFQTLVDLTYMIIVCPNHMFHKIGQLFEHTVRAIWNVTPINSNVDSYFYFSKK